MSSHKYGPVILIVLVRFWVAPEPRQSCPFDIEHVKMHLLSQRFSYEQCKNNVQGSGA